VVIDVVPDLPPLPNRLDDVPLIDSGGRLLLGQKEDGKYLFWDPADPSTAHALVSGATGGGKTVTTRRIAACAERAGYELYLLDAGKGDAFYGFA